LEWAISTGGEQAHVPCHCTPIYPFNRINLLSKIAGPTSRLHGKTSRLSDSGSGDMYMLDTKMAIQRRDFFRDAPPPEDLSV
jgi:hypothetical protein